MGALTVGDVMSSRQRILAAFPSDTAAAEAADALLLRGLTEQRVTRWELAPGRYLMEDAANPELKRKIRVGFALGGLAGAIAGVALVLVALSSSVTPGTLLVGGLSGVLMGLVVGGVVASNRVPIGDNEDEWFTVSDDEHGYVIEARSTSSMPPHTIHAVLREYGAEAFLLPDTTPDKVEFNASAPQTGR